MLLPRARLCPLYALALLLCAAVTHGATDGADADLITLAPAEATALAVDVTAAVPAITIGIDGLLGTVALPVEGTRVVASPYAGRIAHVAVDEGAHVAAGQVLAVVHSRDYADDHAKLIELSSQAEVARRQAARDRILADEGIIATSRAQASRATARQLEAARDAVQAALRPIATAGVAGALASFELRAPSPGIVVRRHVLTGEHVDALAPAFVLATNTAWRVEVHVPVAVSARLQADATLRIGDLDIPVTGRGLTLDEPTQTIIVRGVLPPDSGLVPGQQIVASLRVRAPEGALRIPRSALMRRGEIISVFHATEQGYRSLPVTVLGENRRFAVIEGSIAPGDQVVSAGVSALKSLLAH